MRSGREIPEATVARLPLYLRALVGVAEVKTSTISSDRLADLAGVNASKVRKDLSYLGSYGTRGVGYDVEFLLYQIGRRLGLTQDWPIVIVGAGNLGRALFNHKGFAERGFRVVALFDVDPAKIGERLGAVRILGMEQLARTVADEGVAIGVVTTPPQVAQEVADLLVGAGVSAVLSFAPAVITVPPAVSLRQVDLSIELQILSFYQQRAAVGLLRDPEPDDPEPDDPEPDDPEPDDAETTEPAVGGARQGLDTALAGLGG